MREKTTSEDVLRAARAVFLRFGFRRTTMGDLAEEAGISRPALYLVFPSKEDVFRAVLREVTREELAEIRAGLPERETPAAKLEYAFAMWSVRNYELTRASPGAADLFECSLEFAGDVAREADAAFETIVTEILAPLVQKDRHAPASARKLARMMAHASLGFKASASSSGELRASLETLAKVVLASLAHPSRR